MSWIEDIKYELLRLADDYNALKKFGVSVGLFLALLAVIFYIAGIFETVRIVIICLGLVLLIFGIINPLKLKKVHYYWMAFAFTLGWFISRFILSIIFFLIITPISIIAKAVNKKFLQLDQDKHLDSFWIKKKQDTTNYNKMY